MMFQDAVKMKLRFPSQRGRITVEDLWDLSVHELDGIFKTLNRQVRVVEEESLLNTVSHEDSVLRLQIDIVKVVVETKLEEQAENEGRVLKNARKQKLLAIIESKQETELHEMDIEELEELLNKL